MNIDLFLENLKSVFAPKKYKKVHIAIISAENDKGLAGSIINALRELKLKCWYAESVLPGQDWKLEHGRAYKEADLVFFLVTKSTLKEGNHLRYARLVLDIQEEKPDSGLKLIPIRFDECEVPDFLGHLRYLDAASLEDISKITKAWDVEAARRTRAEDWPDYKSFKTEWK